MHKQTHELPSLAVLLIISTISILVLLLLLPTRAPPAPQRALDGVAQTGKSRPHQVRSRSA